MQTKRIVASDFEYEVADFDGTNTSGLNPLADTVIVMCDVAPDKTAGNLFITADTQLRQQMMAETGVIVAIGEGAFKWLSDRTRPWIGRVPEVGEHIAFERYAGREQTGLDGKQYRVMTDRVIAATIDRDQMKSAKKGAGK